MAYKNIQEAARDLAPRLAEREPRITFRLLSYTEDLSLLMPRILEEDPRLLLCVSAVRTRELGWTGGRTIALEPEYTKLLASSVSVLGLEKETEEAVEKEVEAAACQAVRFHQRSLRLVFPGMLQEAVKRKIDSLTGHWIFLNCGLRGIQVDQKQLPGCSCRGIQVTFFYSCTYRKMRERMKAVSEAAEEIARIARKEGAEDWRRAFAAVRYCVGHWSYGSLEGAPSQEFTAYGALVNKRAVCMGISLAVCEIFRRLSIPCRYIYGTRGNTGHAWNLVCLRGGWFYIDVTDAIVRGDPFFHWGMTELSDRRAANPCTEPLSCRCGRDFIQLFFRTED